MDTHNPAVTIDQIRADRRLVEELFAHGKLTRGGRQAALEFLNPHAQWGLWLSRVLLALGTTLLLAGAVYFFAFNWHQITPAVKLASIQIALLASLAGSYRYGLARLSGQVLLSAASVLVGVFLAVFGQIYQTGADAYQLFMVWALLIIGWTALSNFAAQWILWLVIANVAVVLWWQQAALPTYDMEFLIFGYLAVLNGLALALREIGAHRGYAWLDARWTRVLLTIVTLGVLLIPVLGLILEGGDASQSILLTACVGLIGHVAFYAVYRHILRDMWSLAATLLSICVILETATYRGLTRMFGDFDAAALLSLGLLTLVIFTAAIVYLRKVAARLETSHG